MWSCLSGSGRNWISFLVLLGHFSEQNHHKLSVKEHLPNESHVLNKLWTKLFSVLLLFVFFHVSLVVSTHLSQVGCFIFISFFFHVLILHLWVVSIFAASLIILIQVLIPHGATGAQIWSYSGTGETINWFTFLLFVLESVQVISAY